MQISLQEVKATATRIYNAAESGAHAYAEKKVLAMGQLGATPKTRTKERETIYGECDETIKVLDAIYRRTLHAYIHK